MDRVRRNLLGGALVAGSVLGVAKEAIAQNAVVSKPAEVPQPVAPVVAPQSPADAPVSQDIVNRTVKPAPVSQDWANLRRYHQASSDAKAGPASARRVVMMGDSITDAWPSQSNGLFAKHGLVGRGISGQTTAQMLVRFWAEVIDLKPQVVHILAGTNDIAENLDLYDFEQTARNLSAMAAMARANGIRVVMGAVPPATSFGWRLERGNPSALIKVLNTWIQTYCRKSNLVYADYWSVLANAEGGLKSELGVDSVHPNAAGYAVMAPIALNAIATARRDA